MRYIFTIHYSLFYIHYSACRTEENGIWTSGFSVPVIGLWMWFSIYPETIIASWCFVWKNERAHFPDGMPVCRWCSFSTRSRGRWKHFLGAGAKNNFQERFRKQKKLTQERKFLDSASRSAITFIRHVSFFNFSTWLPVPISCIRQLAQN